MSKGNLTTAFANEITQYNAERGLKSIAVAESAEIHFARAKDISQLQEAITAKLEAQRDYIIWRDNVVVPSRQIGKRKKSHGISDRKSQNLPAADPGNVVAHRWRKALKAPDAFEATKTAATNKAVKLCELDKTIRGTQGTGENEWYTPEEYIQAARDVFGEIDLDPASSDKAQEIVGAQKHFTKADNGLARQWHGRIWLNPPYAQPDIANFVSKMADEWKSGRVQSAIMLTHNYTDTEWFHVGAGACSAICFTRGRIKFYSPDGDIAAPTQGQAFFYFGPDTERFREVFSAFGFVVRRG